MLPRHITCLFMLTLGASGAETAGTTFGLHRSTDDGRSWSQVGRGLPPDLRVEALGHGGNMRFAGTERGLYVSSDDGGTWTRPGRGVPEDLKVFDFATNSGRAFCATARGVWASSDHGRSWSPAGAGLAQIKVLSLAVSDGLLFAGTDQRGMHVLREPHAGWENASTGLPEGAQIFQFTVNEGALFAALYSRGVFRHDATNRKWISAGQEWPLRLVAAGGVLFAGRNPGGVFTSRDGGTSWISTGRGLPDNAPTWCLASRGNTVRIGTAGRAGLMRYETVEDLWTPSDRGLPPGDSAITLGAAEKSMLVVTISANRPTRGKRTELDGPAR